MLKKRLAKRLSTLLIAALLLAGTTATGSVSTIAEASHFSDTIDAFGDVQITKTFHDEALQRYVARFDADDDGCLSPEERGAVRSLEVPDDATSLENIEVFVNLEHLSCHSGSIEAIDCEDGGLLTLDVSGCTALETLTCAKNKLTALDISGCGSLITLNCRGNQLTSLDVSENPRLEDISCYDNQLEALDVSHCPELRKLWCQQNALESLKLGDCERLLELNCNDNMIPALDVDAAANLLVLMCSGNLLTALDIRSCTALMVLQCDSNDLTELDLSHNPELYSAQCQYNPLTALDISNNPHLIEVVEAKEETLDYPQWHYFYQSHPDDDFHDWVFYSRKLTIKTLDAIGNTYTFVRSEAGVSCDSKVKIIE